MRCSEWLAVSYNNRGSPVPKEYGSSVVTELTNSTSAPGCDSDDADDTNGDTEGGGHDIDMSCGISKKLALERSDKDLSTELLDYFMVVELLT